MGLGVCRHPLCGLFVGVGVGVRLVTSAAIPIVPPVSSSLLSAGRLRRRLRLFPRPSLPLFFFLFLFIPARELSDPHSESRVCRAA